MEAVELFGHENHSDLDGDITGEQQKLPAHSRWSRKPVPNAFQYDPRSHPTRLYGGVAEVF